MIRASALAVLLVLGGCRDDRPPVPTTEESEQLNEVEELLNEQAAKEKRAGE